MPKRTAGWFLLLLTLGLVGCDHATKVAAEGALPHPITLVRGLVELAYVQNHETAFSLSRHLHLPAAYAGARPYLLAAVALLSTALIAIAAWTRRHKASPLERLATAFVVAGAIGNLSDRLVRGYVVDFIHVRYWPVFNVADVLVVVGGALLALITLTLATFGASGRTATGPPPTRSQSP
jgi:signal peptidase II